MYLGRDKIREIKETDLLTPLGEKVSEVFFMSELDLLNESMDSMTAQLEVHRAERGELKSDTDEAKALDALMETLDKELDELSDKEAPLQTERSIYASERSLKHQTDDPSDTYYEARKFEVTKAVLSLMAEWNLQDIEIGGILQWIQQSYQQNVLEAVGKKFGKKQMDLNMLDYHNALTSDRKDN